MKDILHFRRTHLFVSLDVQGIVNLLKIGNRGSAEDTNKTSEEVSGFRGVVLKILNLLDESFYRMDLLFSGEPIKWLELRLVSVFVVVFDLLLPKRRVNNVFLLTDDLKIMLTVVTFFVSYFLDVILDIVNLLKNNL